MISNLNNSSINLKILPATTITELIIVVAGAILLSFKVVKIITFELDYYVNFSPSFTASNNKDYGNLIDYKKIDNLFFADINYDKIENNAAPQTSINAKIYGIRFDPTGQSSAIIKLPGGEQKRVVAGDYLGTIRIVSIKANYIEIINNNKVESIFLSKKVSIKPSSKRYVENIKTDHKDNHVQFNILKKNLDLTLYNYNSKKIGFMIGANAQINFLNRYNLEIGDILLKINDIFVTNDEKLKEGIVLTLNSNDIKLKIERNGLEKNIDVKF